MICESILNVRVKLDDEDGMLFINIAYLSLLLLAKEEL